MNEQAPLLRVCSLLNRHSAKYLIVGARACSTACSPPKMSEQAPLLRVCSLLNQKARFFTIGV
jgi:hypothetical protein